MLLHTDFTLNFGGHHFCNFMVVGFKSIDAIGAYHTSSTESGSHLWKGVLDWTTFCDEVCQWLDVGRWFFPVSSTNKTEMLLKVVLNIYHTHAKLENM